MPSGIWIVILAPFVACTGGSSPLPQVACTGGSSPPPQEDSGAPGCPSSPMDIPDSLLFRGDDARLRGESLIVVCKQARRVMLFERGSLADPGCWPIGLGRGAPTGHKQEEGDYKTPEGWYRTSDKPTSRYWDAIAIHYPNAKDAGKALSDERITRRTYSEIIEVLAGGYKPPQQTALGGEILIHGGGAADWTEGCIALADEDLRALRAGLPEGMATDILVLP